MPASTDLCGFCSHPRSEHCKGNVPHGDWKTKAGSYFGKSTPCKGTHCNSPMCCCLEFIEPDQSLKAAIEGISNSLFDEPRQRDQMPAFDEPEEDFAETEESRILRMKSGNYRHD